MTAAAPALSDMQADSPGVSRWLEFPCDWRRGDAGGAYVVYRNDAQGYGQMLPRPAPEDIPGFYDVNYYTHADDSFLDETEGSLRWRVLRHLAWLADRGSEPTNAWWAGTLGDAPKRCLEIGCGHGERLDRFRAMGHDVTGVEPDPDAREEAAARGIPVFEGTAESLPAAIDGQKFDCVAIIHALEHFLDPQLALANARELLAPGGTLVIEVPNNNCAGIGHFGRDWLFLDVPRHLNFFTAASLRAMVAQAGFTETGLIYRGYAMQFTPAWIHDQGQICRALGDNPAVNCFGSHLRYFIKTALAPQEAKYCGIRISATLAEPA